MPLIFAQLICPKPHEQLLFGGFSRKCFAASGTGYRGGKWWLGVPGYATARSQACGGDTCRWGLRGRCAAAPAHAWPRNQRTRSPVPQRSRAAAGRPSNTAAQLDMAIAGVQISARAQLPSLLLASKESPCCLLSDAPTAVCARGLSSQREATAQGQLITDPRRCRAVFRGGCNSRGLSVDVRAKPATAASRCATC